MTPLASWQIALEEQISSCCNAKVWSLAESYCYVYCKGCGQACNTKPRVTDND